MFPQCVFYNRFVELEKEVLLPLTIFIGCEDILVENCVGWTDCTNVFLADPWSAERFVNLGPDYIQNVTFRNCIVLETPTLYDNKEGDEGWRGGCAAINHVLAYTRNLAVGWTDV